MTPNLENRYQCIESEKIFQPPHLTVHPSASLFTSVQKPAQILKDVSQNVTWNALRVKCIHYRLPSDPGPGVHEARGSRALNITLFDKVKQSYIYLTKTLLKVFLLYIISPCESSLTLPFAKIIKGFALYHQLNNVILHLDEDWSTSEVKKW